MRPHIILYITTVGARMQVCESGNVDAVRASCNRRGVTL